MTFALSELLPTPVPVAPTNPFAPPSRAGGHAAGNEQVYLDAPEGQWSRPLSRAEAERFYEQAVRVAPNDPEAITRSGS